MEKVRTIGNPPPRPNQWCLIAGLHCPHVARYNGNGAFLIEGFLPGVPRPLDRVDWWAPLPPEFTAQYDEPDAVAECRVEGWGPRETVRNG